MGLKIKVSTASGLILNFTKKIFTFFESENFQNAITKIR